MAPFITLGEKREFNEVSQQIIREWVSIPINLASLVPHHRQLLVNLLGQLGLANIKVIPMTVTGSQLTCDHMGYSFSLSRHLSGPTGVTYPEANEFFRTDEVGDSLVQFLPLANYIQGLMKKRQGVFSESVIPSEDFSLAELLLKQYLRDLADPFSKRIFDIINGLMRESIRDVLSVYLFMEEGTHAWSVLSHLYFVYQAGLFPYCLMKDESGNITGIVLFHE